jgi:replication fork clamp-binding protein CrfC
LKPQYIIRSGHFLKQVVIVISQPHGKSMIEALRDEAIRLIDIELHIIRSMMQSPRLPTSSSVGEAQTIDAESAPKRVEVLEGEKTKLADLELVLAVVGTMKAGKSTTINAIIGAEVLPNRNRPMTALPTLIRHTSGQIEPRLLFKNIQPIEHLMSELRKKLKSPANKVLRDKCQRDSEDIAQLIALIEHDDTFQSGYQGAEEIFEFLRSLNDLVRLSSDLDVTFPFDQYTKIGELPVIEVEFAHLREAPQSTGRLTLLDTPGPNESGQPHLKKMLREQLAKASAILAVLDFTQLKSDADAQVRLELLDLAKVTENRLYVLVNKFDQKDRNGDGYRAVQNFVANNLLDGHITADNVFPVSSKLAYLANSARHALQLQGVLPDHTKHAWVADFGKEAFGSRWESRIDDRDEVIKSAEALWADALFAAPLEKVIRAAHARAAIFAVESAAAKLLDTAEVIESLLSVRNTALKKSTSELKQQIDALQKQLSDIDDIEKKASAESVNTLLGQNAWQQTRQWVGLSVGVGISATKTLAKLANHVAQIKHEYQGVCHWDALGDTTQRNILQRLPASEVWGVGRQLTEKLVKLGIESVWDLQQSDAAWMQKRFSIIMERTIRDLRGESCIALIELAPPKHEIHSSRSFSRPVTQIEELSEALSVYTVRAVNKLRQQESVCAALRVFIRTDPFRPDKPQYHATHTVALSIPSQEPRVLIQASLTGLRALYRPGLAYARIGVHLLELSSIHRQQTDFLHLMSPMPPQSCSCGLWTPLMLALGAIDSISVSQDYRACDFKSEPSLSSDNHKEKV